VEAVAHLNHLLALGEVTRGAAPTGLGSGRLPQIGNTPDTAPHRDAAHRADRQGNPVTSRGADRISGRTRFMADNDYKHGEMDITEQEKTFGGFMRYSVNIAIACIVIIISPRDFRV
jgi:hypothetical protein